MSRCFSFSTIISLSSVTSADNRKRFGRDITIPLLAPCSSYDDPLDFDGAEQFLRMLPAAGAAYNRYYYGFNS